MEHMEHMEHQLKLIASSRKLWGYGQVRNMYKIYRSGFGVSNSLKASNMALMHSLMKGREDTNKQPGKALAQLTGHIEWDGISKFLNEPLPNVTSWWEDKIGDTLYTSNTESFLELLVEHGPMSYYKGKLHAIGWDENDWCVYPMEPQTDFSFTSFGDVHFMHSNLEGADFESTRFEHCNFRMCNLTNVNMKMASFYMCDFNFARMIGVIVDSDTDFHNCHGLGNEFNNDLSYPDSPNTRRTVRRTEKREKKIQKASNEIFSKYIIGRQKRTQGGERVPIGALKRISDFVGNAMPTRADLIRDL